MFVSRAREHPSESPSRAPAREAESPTHSLLRLQRAAGNGAVARLIERAGVQRDSMEEEEEVQASHDVSSIGRQEEEEEMMLKRDDGLRPGAVGLEGGDLPSGAAEQVEQARGGGTAVSERVRDAVEPVLGVSVEGVRVHQDARSDALARTMTARAFTSGTDVFLRSDMNAGDERLMAHELAHVAQQADGGGGPGGVGGRLTVGAAEDPSEAEADRVADAVAQGRHDEQAEEA